MLSTSRSGLANVSVVSEDALDIIATDYFRRAVCTCVHDNDDMNILSS
jgi:hypothetical protein